MGTWSGFLYRPPVFFRVLQGFADMLVRMFGHSLPVGWIASIRAIIASKRKQKKRQREDLTEGSRVRALAPGQPFFICNQLAARKSANSSRTGA